jgi:hypothetical protein
MTRLRPKPYEPDPLPTTGVALPDALAELTERLARHIHDTWARRRMQAGWTWGPERDDAARTHPGLVAYDELSESEKEYDRETALEALRAIVALGYRIVPPPAGEGV